jgi:hypothetical protein
VLGRLVLGGSHCSLNEHPCDIESKTPLYPCQTNGYLGRDELLLIRRSGPLWWDEQRLVPTGNGPDKPRYFSPPLVEPEGNVDSTHSLASWLPECQC